MSELLRSKTMQYVRVNMVEEDSQAVLKVIGHLGFMHLEDLNEGEIESNNPERYMMFRKRVADCEQWKRRLLFFGQQMKLHDVTHDVLAPGGDFLDQDIDVINSIRLYLEPLEDELTRHTQFYNAISSELQDLRDRYSVLNILSTKFADVFRPSPLSPTSTELEMALIDDEKAVPPPSALAESGDRLLNTIVGVIPLSQCPQLDRMVYLLSKGNAFVRFSEIEDYQVYGEMKHDMSSLAAAVFVIACIGQGTLFRRLKRCLEFLDVKEVDVPQNSARFASEMTSISNAITDKEPVLQETRLQIRRILEAVSFDHATKMSPYNYWMAMLHMEKQINYGLRSCFSTPGSNIMTLEGWIHKERYAELESELQKVHGHFDVMALTPPYGCVPPTSFELNKFTSAFQNIVNTYGVPRYKEINPGLFTIITFPFLFGIMFGDIGHGLVLCLGALVLILNEDKIADLQKREHLNEGFTSAFSGRYMLLLMGLFASYAGFIYNDCLSLPLNLFGSGWDMQTVRRGNTTELVGFGPETIYPIGVDPNWYYTTNELTFFNSLKMKLSVITGVVHMTFGLFLSMLNHIHYKDYPSLFFEFVPQFVFMCSTFGYMILMIIVKWTIDWKEKDHPAPNLIQTMIDMFLSPGTVPAEKELYEGQAGFQAFLVVLAMLSVPCMLLLKPFYLLYYKSDYETLDRRAHNLKHAYVSPRAAALEFMATGGVQELKYPEEPAVVIHGQGATLELERKASESVFELSSPERPEEAMIYNFFNAHHVNDVSELMIHQAIHTIEFVLGTVSNTASYLRLWALSLAHAELANVFWTKLVMEYGVATGSGPFVVVTFAAWAGASALVLLCMDSLECFLHALRLHWVEFQNKFYHADGYEFTPFSTHLDLEEEARTA